MGRFQIIEAKAHHCGAIIRRLREDHQAAVALLGINSHREIRERFDASAYRRAWSIDGRLAGLGGVTGSTISGTGFAWMALTNEAARHPYAVARETLRQIADIMLVKREIVTTLIPEDKLALRFATRLGFEVDHGVPIPYGRGHVIAVRYGRGHTVRKAA